MFRFLVAAMLAFTLGAGAVACGGSSDQPKPSGGIPGY